ncbi:hypothetical protein [Shewanella xiamenensis]|uniref:hypothetical protein n=1 Tax=Shewanella xiamenensis TaxID=332186 RepID=UPI00294A2A2E|nr:hypothetical protein [Shewanella xiamenensis]MDV5245503.1 hypothetical protein [Shewanella xiamenensis]
MPSTVLLLIFLPFCSFLTVPDRIGVLLLLIFGVSLSLIPFTGKAIIFSVVGILFACFKLNKSIFVVICVVSFVVVPIYIENIISLLGEFGLHNTAYKLSMIYNVILNQSFIFNNLNTSVGSTLLEIFSSYNWLFHYESFNFFGRGFNGYLTDSNLGIIGLDGFSEFSLRHNMYYSLHMPWLNLILSIGLWTFMMIFVMSFLIESKYLLFVYFLIFAVTPQLSLLVIILIVSDNSTEKVANLRF